MDQCRNLNRVMETGDHFKNGASPKSQMSRRNIIQKIVLYIAVFCISAVSAFSQDIITLKNGNDIQALVQEIGDLEVKYKKFDNPNGPNYSMKKSEIFMIRYANGSKDVFVENAEPVAEPAKTSIEEQKNNQSQANTRNESDFLSVKNAKVRNQNGVQLRHSEILKLMKADPAAFAYYNQGVSNRRTATGLRVSGITFLVISFAGSIVYYTAPEYNRDSNLATLSGLSFILSLAFNIPATILTYSGNSKIATAVDIYNNSIHKQQNQNMTMNFGITQSGGIGFTLNF